MSNAICIDQNLFILGTIVLVAITFYYIKNPSYFGCPTCPVCPVCTIGNKDLNDENNIKTIGTETIYNQMDPLIARDIDAISNPLIAPTKRVPRHVYPVPPITRSINIPTRGAFDNYQYLGNLVRTSDEKIVKLFGRQTYPGSTKYEYYGITNDSSGSVKVKIESTNLEQSRITTHIPILVAIEA